VLAALAAIPAAHATMPPRAGTIPAEVRSGFDSGLFAVPSTGGLRASSSPQTEWIIPVLMIGFSDQPIAHSEAEFDFALFDTLGLTPTGSVFDYYRWVSGNRIRVTGRVVATVQLPRPKAFYGGNAWGLNLTDFPGNSAGAVIEALIVSEPQVNWSPYDLNRDGFVDMLWVVHSGVPGEATVSRENLWSITSRLSSWPNAGIYDTFDPIPGLPLSRMRIDRFTMLPELSAIRPNQRTEIGVYCHEFGHALGLPDLYDTSANGGAGTSNIGLGNWSLMASGGYGGDGQTPEYPTHMGAWPTLFMGWNQTVRPTADTLVSLGPLARGAPILELWYQGEASSEHFLIEHRRRESFDRNLPNDGLIVYQVDEAAIGLGLPSNRVIGVNDAMRVVAADGQRDLEQGSNHGDAEDPFPGQLGRTLIDDDTVPNLRTFAGAVNNLVISDIRAVGEDFRFHATVRAQGWLPPEDHSLGPFNPAPSFGPSTRAIRHANGTISAVCSEVFGGRAQVVLREKANGETWLPPLQVSQSPGQAFDPTIAMLPDGDLGIAWSDTRHGVRELYFRSRINGVWTAERRLTDLPGDSRNASLGADPMGGMHLAWVYNDAASVRVYFMYFPYYSPFGDPHPVTAPSDRPDTPALAVAPDGGSYVVWADRATIPSSTIWFSHFHPDSGLSPRRSLYFTGGLAQTNPQAVVDTAGALNVIWQVISTSTNEIHYQRRRPAAVSPAPRDTIIEARGESIQEPMLGVDPHGGVHLGLISSANTLQIRYKRWVPGRGWDRVSTEVTHPEDGNAIRPTLLPTDPGHVTLLYIGYPDGSAAFMERRREFGPTLVTEVVEPPRNAAKTLRLAHNPIRAGSPLQLAGDALLSAGERVEVLDLAGRRMATAAAEPTSGGWEARIGGEVTSGWRSGVYWVRLRGGSGSARVVVLR
jgi:immune inhibitor A